MARAKVNRGMDSETAQQVISMAVGAAEAPVMRIGHLAKRAIAETARAAEEAGTELGAALARITPPRARLRPVPTVECRRRSPRRVSDGVGVAALHSAVARLHPLRERGVPVYFGGLACLPAVTPSRSAMRTSSASVSACIFRMI
jgi:hypothetical protein